MAVKARAEVPVYEIDGVENKTCEPYEPIVVKTGFLRGHLHLKIGGKQYTVLAADLVDAVRRTE